MIHTILQSPSHSHFIVDPQIQKYLLKRILIEQNIRGFAAGRHPRLGVLHRVAGVQEGEPHCSQREEQRRDKSAELADMAEFVPRLSPRRDHAAAHVDEVLAESSLRVIRHLFFSSFFIGNVYQIVA